MGKKILSWIKTSDVADDRCVDSKLLVISMALPLLSKLLFSIITFPVVAIRIPLPGLFLKALFRMVN